MQGMIYGYVRVSTNNQSEERKILYEQIKKTFGKSTILAWHSFGKINMVYLFGEKIINVYIAIALAFIFVGTLASSDF